MNSNKRMGLAAYQELLRSHPVLGDQSVAVLYRGGERVGVRLTRRQDSQCGALGALPFPLCDDCGQYHWGRCNKTGPETYTETVQQGNIKQEVVRFRGVAADAPNRQERLTQQREDFEQAAKSGQVVCLSDLLGNHGM